MQRLKMSLEDLDEMISVLEDRVEADAQARQEAQRRAVETLRQSQTREAQVFAVAQKVASRLDQTIRNVEQTLKD